MDKRLEKQGALVPLKDGIVDAEFYDVDDEAKPTVSLKDEPKSEWRPGIIALATVGVITMLLFITGLFADDPSAQSAPPVPVSLLNNNTDEAAGGADAADRAADEAERAADAMDSSVEPAEGGREISQWLGGNWILAPKGGEDGQTVCQDLSAPNLYRSNGDTGQIRSFKSDGTYRSLFVYTTPSSARHQTFYAGRWVVKNDKLELSGISATDMFRSEGGTFSAILMRRAENVLFLEMDGDAQRYVRCVGATGGLYGN